MSVSSNCRKLETIHIFEAALECRDLVQHSNVTTFLDRKREMFYELV